MPDLKDIQAITFDCYGTLIDWESGILDAMRMIMGSRRVEIDAHEVLRLYAQLEAALERGGYRPYREVLSLVAKGIGEHYGVTLDEQERDGLAMSVGEWKPFGDTLDALQKLTGKYRLVICSNIDDDLMAQTLKRLEYPFTHVVTAQMCRSYKPDPRHFRVALAMLDLPPDRALHVAESRYHDIAPARAMGMPTVWVNRHGPDESPSASGRGEARPNFEVRDLGDVARLLVA